MNRSKSFSLIELLVVLTIISLVIGLTTAYIFNFRKGSVLSLSAQEIVATLNQARSLSITKQDEYKVVFDINNNKYVLRDPLDSYDVEPERSLKEGIIIESISSSFVSGNVIFSSTGGLSGASGSVVIKNNQDKRKTITIINSTGRIKVSNS